jgi:type III restriction enzyme
MMCDVGPVAERPHCTGPVPDVLSAVDWRGFDPQDIVNRIPENAQAAESQLQRISLTDSPDHFEAQLATAGAEALRFDPPHAVRMISDIMPNPFVGREIVGRFLARWRSATSVSPRSARWRD